jgi:nucleotide-binding universal stress UspA family protein
MSYKTILVHLDNSKHTEDRIAVAASLARSEQGAHVIGTAMTGISRFVFQAATSTPESIRSPTYINTQIDTLQSQAEMLLDKFDNAAIEAGINSYERRLVDDESYGGISLQARYADLVVLSQEDPEDPGAGITSDLPEYIALTSGRPVLVIPYAGKLTIPFNNIVIAWDASLEATRAVHHALPLLQRANNVHVAVFNSSRQRDVHGEEPGADIALYLSRQNVNVEVLQLEVAIDIGNALLSLCADLQTELIVMGCYGHTRFHEILLGGVSRTVLQSMTTPVFMAH